MARRRRANKRETIRDVRYDSEDVSRLVNKVMNRGKKSVAQRVVYGALDEMGKMTKQDSIEVFQQALNNVKPRLEVKSRRVGGATYQVPIEVSSARQLSLALRWIVQYAGAKKGLPMGRALALELVDAYNRQGSSVKKREDTHKMAQANKAFAHYRW